MGQLSSGQTPDIYVLDANVFMTAWWNTYPPDLFPGFWQCLEYYSRDGRLLSIDRVRDEILSPAELVEWVERASGYMFKFSGEQKVVDTFAEIQAWVNGSPQFLPAAKDGFARVADGWLAAYANVYNAVLVTNEVVNENARNRVPLPNICRRFGIRYKNTLQMLRSLGVKFEWKQEP